MASGRPTGKEMRRVTITMPDELYIELLNEVHKRKVNKNAEANMSALICDLTEKSLKHIRQAKAE